MLSTHSLPIYGLLRATIAGAEAQGTNDAELAQMLVLILQPDDSEVNTAEAASYLRKSVPTLERWRWKKVGPRYRTDPTGLIRYRIGWLKEYQNQGAFSETT